MKTILVDAYRTLVLENDHTIDRKIYALLENFSNKKIILTNAPLAKQASLRLVNLPYTLFSLSNAPSKSEPEYYYQLLDHFDLRIDDVIYIEHNIDALNSAETVGIVSYHFDKDKRDLTALIEFITSHL